MSSTQAFALDEIGELDAASYVPLYMQLATAIAARIREQGEKAVGKVLPSELACAQRLGISRPTVRQAMSQLLTQGLITRARGRGTFVAPLNLEHDLSHGFEDDMQAAKRPVGYTLLGWDRVAMPDDIAEIFGLELQDECFLLRRLRHVEDEIVGLEERYVPGRFANKLSRRDLATRPILNLLLEVAGRSAGRLQIEVSGAVADRELAGLLRTKRGAPLLQRKSTFATDPGGVLMHGSVTFLAAHYKFRVSVPYAPARLV